MNNLILTGDRGIGKTTLVNKIMDKVSLAYGGYMTGKYENETELKFKIVSVSDTSETYTMANIIKEGQIITVNKDSFNKGAVSILKRSLENCGCIVLDELGFLESECLPFQKQVHAVLDSDVPVIGVLKKHNCEFVNSIKKRNDIDIIEITKENRDFLLESLSCKLLSFLLEKH